jgi:myosin phosphatase Rho-interacting protein
MEVFFRITHITHLFVQATLAALDAMRKAHQNEVQREIARFKQDFVKQFQKNGQPSSYKERE